MPTIATSFTPAIGQTQQISATVASASITLSALGRRQPQIRVNNQGTTTAYIRVGLGSQTATAADNPLRGGDAMVIDVGGDGADTVAAIMSSGTATIDVTPGYGGA
jgi:hypothetical protein